VIMFFWEVKAPFATSLAAQSTIMVMACNQSLVTPGDAGVLGRLITHTLRFRLVNHYEHYSDNTETLRNHHFQAIPACSWCSVQPS
jgi:hypothetical protein